MPALAQGAVTVTDTLGAVYDGADAVRLVVRNNSGSVTVYLGDSAVTAENGWPLFPGEGYEWPIRIDDRSAVYAVTDSGTADVRWMTVT
jgi:hypothetical protein